VPRFTSSPGLRRKLQVYRRGLAGAPVSLQLVGDPLAFAKAANAGSLERGGVNEYVLAAAGWMKP